MGKITKKLFGIIVFLLVATMAFTLTACDKKDKTPEDATAFITAVESIGTVTLDSKDPIDQAFKLYDKLSGDSKALEVVIVAKGTLDSAKTTYDALLKADEVKKAAEAFIGLANAIPSLDSLTISTANEQKIKAAEDAYTALTAEQKAFAGVSAANDKVTAARAKYLQLADEAQAQAFKVLVNKIDIEQLTGSAADTEKIDAALEAYEALSEAAKAVDGVAAAYAKIEAAQEKMAELKTAAEAKVFTDLVAAIPAVDALEISEAHEKTIADARASYTALSEAAKAVDGVAAALTTLEAAEAKMAELKAEDEAKEFLRLVGEIPALADITTAVETAHKIEAAREEYDALSTDAKALDSVAAALVTLEAAEAKMAQLKVAAEAKAFIDLATAIPAVDALVISQAHEKAISDARASYSALSEAAKAVDGVAAALVTLEAAEAKMAQLKADAEADAFIILAEKIPAITEATATDDTKALIDAAKASYTVLSNAAKEVAGVADAYAKVLAAETEWAKLIDSARLADFMAKAELVPNVADINTKSEASIIAAEDAYAKLSEAVKAGENVIAAYEKVQAAREAFNAKGYKQIPVPPERLIFSGDVPGAGGGAFAGPNVFLANGEAFWKPLKDFYGVTDLNGKIKVYLNIYLDSEKDATKYIARHDVALNTQFFIKGNDIMAVFQKASISNDQVVSGNYKFTTYIEDLTGERRDSGYSEFTGSTKYVFKSASELIVSFNALPTVEGLTISAENDKLINTARTVYNALPQIIKDAQAFKEAYAKLLTVETAYNKLKSDDAAAKAFIKLANALPQGETVTLESLTAIAAAEAAYTALTPEAKVLTGVAEANALVISARAKYEELKAAYDAANLEAANAFIALANALPSVESVTLESLTEIEAVETAYAALTADAQKLEGVAEAKAKMEAARAKYDELKANDKDTIDAKAFNDLVTALPEVGAVALTDLDAIVEAETYYGAMTERAKGLEGVAASYKKLQDVRAKYNELKAQDDAAKYIAVVAALPSAGELTLDDEAAVVAAEAAYTALSDEAKAVEGVAAAKATVDAARVEIDRLQAQKDAADYIAVVKALPVVDELTLDNADAVAAAEAAYEALSDAAKAVEGVSTAKETVANLRAKLTQLQTIAEAKVFTDLAALIPTGSDLTASDEDLAKIKAAEDAYNGLSEEARAIDGVADAWLVVQDARETCSGIIATRSTIDIVGADGFVLTARTTAVNYNGQEANTIQAKVAPGGDALATDVIWESSDPSIASIAGGTVVKGDGYNLFNGNITPLKAGKVVITAKLAASGDVVSTMKLEVLASVQGNLITTISGLKTFNGILANDIDMTGYNYEGKAFIAHDVANATLNGNGYAIKNIDFELSTQVNGFINKLVSTKVLNVKFQGRLSGMPGQPGGLVFASDGVTTFSNCLFEMFLDTTSNQAGVFGYLYGPARIENCIFLTTVKESGLSVDKNANPKAAVVNKIGAVENIYVDKTLINNDNVVGIMDMDGIMVTTEFLQTAVNFADWTAWYTIDGQYPVLENIGVVKQIVVSLNKKAAEVVMKETVTLIATVKPDEEVDKSVTWTTSDPTIATVNDGVVAGVAAGTATITATSVKDPTKSASCTVNVLSDTELLFTTDMPAELAMTLGDASQYTAVVRNGTLGTASWTTSDANIATVVNGLITAVAPGTATVTVTCDDDDTKTYSCVITIEDPYKDYVKIATAADFAKYFDGGAGANNLKMCLTADIDLAGMTKNLWMAGEFAGVFDGRGHQVKNLKFTQSFLNIMRQGSIVRNTEFIYDVSSQNGFVYLNNGLIEDCIFRANACGTGNTNVLGLNGAGGLTKNCLEFITVAEGQPAGNVFAGYVQGGNCKDVFYLCDSGIQAGGPTKKADAELKVASLYANWSAKSWSIVDGEIPTLKQF